MAATKERLGGRHRAFEATLRRNLESVASLVPGARDLDEQRALLFGAFVTAEYSFEAAALFNPSVIPHPDQSGLEDGALRLAMSLRGIGEGHVSSITLRSLVWYGDGRLELREPSTFAVSPEIKWLPGGGAQLICADSEDVSESILFPVLPHQSRGLEDMRLVRLVEPDGDVRYLGTYTAVGPDGIGLEILEGHDFRTFDLWPVKGEIARSKGGALFPRQVDGRYLMISRHDGESLWLAQSDDLSRLGRAAAVDGGTLALGICPDRQLRLADRAGRGLAAAHPWGWHGPELQYRRLPARSQRPLQGAGAAARAAAEAG